MPKTKREMSDQSLLDKGIKIILYAYNEQKKEFSKNINQLESEIKKLKEENYIYKNKLSILQQKLNTLSKTVCVLDEEAEEAKNDIDKKILESRKVMATVNNEYYVNKTKKKNNSVNNKFSLYKNFLLQNKNNNNFPNNKEVETKNSNLKVYSNNLQYNLKYIMDSPRNATYNKAVDKFNHYKRKKNVVQNDNSGTHNSFLIENTPRDNDINLNEDSRTDRDFHKRKIFSEKFLEINKRKHGNNYANNKMKELLNMNNNSTNSININDLNDDSNMKKNEDDLYRKNNNISNLCSKITSENEIYFKDMKISGDNNSKLYKKLNIFLEECRVKLNALDYENVINLLKSFEIDSNVDVRKKVKKILNNNHKLCKLFDNIFEA